MSEEIKTNGPRKRTAFWRMRPTNEATSSVSFRDLTQDAQARAAAEESWRRHLQRVAQLKKT